MCLLSMERSACAPDEKYCDYIILKAKTGQRVSAHIC